jgi:MFS-type transporter involved in bile tolerance (Atg22 family)
MSGKNITFMGPCIVNVFLSITNEMQRYTIFFIVVSALHVLSGFSTQHQELKNCTRSIGY